MPYLLRKQVEYEWTTECNNAFKYLKKVLATPPILTQPSLGEILPLYLAVFEKALSTFLMREINVGKSQIYFVSNTLARAETQYQKIEKDALDVVVASEKL